MYVQLFKTLHFHLHRMSFVIPILVLLNLNFRVHHAKVDYAQYYEDCNTDLTSTYECGNKTLNVMYPFSARYYRPSYCGPKEFELICEFSNHLPLLDIGSGSKYRVANIDPIGRAIILERYDDFDFNVGDTCSPIVSTTILNRKVFEYSPGIEDLYMFYGCPLNLHVPLISGVRNNFTCKSNYRNKQVVFGVQSLLRDYLDTLNKVCETLIRVPVTRPNLDKFSLNVTMSPEELLYSSFEVQYKINETACSDCTKSGGVCWNNTDSGIYPNCLYKTGKEKISGVRIGIGNIFFLNIIVTNYFLNSQMVIIVAFCALKFPSAASGIVGGSILLLLVLIIYYHRRLKTKHGPFLFFKNISSSTNNVEAFIKQHGSLIPKRFSYSTVKKITNSFKDELGKGGYGNVYRGSLADGRIVAVKVLNATKGNGEDFINEVASIGRTSHVNVVTLFGFCYEGKKQALIFEFMPNGSLEKFIYGTTPLLEGQHLGWERLYSIAIGIARGLEYLHRGCNTRILHFDIKPHNILLDENFCPKISDFGLSKLYTTNDSAVSSLLQARGTIGYIAPEVISRNFGQVSHKSDVYSYGMMILEMVGGRKNVNAGADHTSEIYYPRWLYKRIQFDDVLDLASEISEEDNERAKKMVIVGLWCIQTYPTQRPSIAKVIEMLEGKIAALEIPPNPYLCSAPNSPSNSQTKLVSCSPSGTESTSSP